MSTVRRILIVSLMVAALALVSGCAGESTRLPANPLLLGVDDTRFDFSQQFAFPWDRMYVFAPYSSRDAVNSSLGFEWSGYDQSVIERSDTVNLVVFVKDSKVVGWFEQARSVDLELIATPDGYARSDASFRVNPSELGVALRR